MNKKTCAYCDELKYTKVKQEENICLDCALDMLRTEYRKEIEQELQDRGIVRQAIEDQLEDIRRKIYENN